MTKNEATFAALEQVDARRRGFLAKLLVGGAAAVALPAMSSMALAAEPQEEEEGRGKGKGKGGKGKGQGRGGDPAQMAARMIEMFDKDGDDALNVKELTEALTAMMERRGAGKGKGKGGEGRGKGKGKGKGKGDGDGGNR